MCLHLASRQGSSGLKVSALHFATSASSQCVHPIVHWHSAAYTAVLKHQCRPEAQQLEGGTTKKLFSCENLSLKAQKHSLTKCIPFYWGVRKLSPSGGTVPSSIPQRTRSPWDKAKLTPSTIPSATVAHF